MRTIRCYIDAPLAEGAVVNLPEETTAHLVRVLRLAVGDVVHLFNGDGFDHRAELVSVAKRGAEARVGAALPVGNESPLRITLAQGIARGEKMDLVLQKATELGVAAFAPVSTERTEVRLDAERAGKRLAHLTVAGIGFPQLGQHQRIALDGFGNHRTDIHRLRR